MSFTVSSLIFFVPLQKEIDSFVLFAFKGIRKSVLVNHRSLLRKSTMPTLDGQICSLLELIFETGKILTPFSAK